MVMVLGPRLRKVIVAMYLTEALGCAAWISTLFTGLDPRVLLVAMVLTLATGVLHVEAVAIDIEEKILRALGDASSH